ncbi:MAG: glycosyltransferase [Bacteroidetes bacterium]|nr:MAG: glycosyltransferase [Bacteroidota bacterium]
MKISVVIPALNEATRIEATLASVAAQPGPLEIIVADGGSVDGTRRLATRRATVIRAPRGRARQMNAGARLASGEVLLFLHADTLLPESAFKHIRRALLQPSVEAGTFRLAFDAEHPLLRFYAFCTRFPLPALGFGDRGLFVRRQVFEAVGGFADIPMFEDLDLVRRLHRRGTFRFLPLAVTTAARRFEARGLLRQQMLNAYLWVRYHLGTPPDALVHLYPYADEVRR